jgi:MFS transporter, UMF1 family
MSTVDLETGTGEKGLQRAWYLTWWSSHGYQTSVITVFLGPYLSDVAKAAADRHGYVHPLGIPVRSGSFFPYVVALSVIIQVVTLPVLGALADHGGRKRALLGYSSYIGAVVTTAMYLLHGTNYLLGGALFVVANIAFGASIVVANAYLPDICAPADRDRVSSVGYAWGYVGGSLLLVAHLILYTAHASFGLSKADAVRIALASAGVWWMVFMVSPLRTLPSGAGGAAPTVRAGLRRLRRTLADLVRSHPVTFMFLLAYLVYNDGIQTVITLAATYGSQELKLDQSVLIQAVLLVQVVAVGGALAMNRIARRYGTKRTVLGSLVGWAVTVAVSYTLQAGQVVPFYLLAVAMGLILGGSQALSRSMFTHLIPKGSEAEYFGLYQISDRGMSWLGPLVFGIALQVTGSYRSSIVSLVVFFVAGFVLLLMVNLPRGIREAGNPVPDRI